MDLEEEEEEHKRWWAERLSQGKLLRGKFGSRRIELNSKLLESIDCTIERCRKLKERWRLTANDLIQSAIIEYLDKVDEAWYDQMTSEYYDRHDIVGNRYLDPLKDRFRRVALCILDESEANYIFCTSLENPAEPYMTRDKLVELVRTRLGTGAFRHLGSPKTLHNWASELLKNHPHRKKRGRPKKMPLFESS